MFIQIILTIFIIFALSRLVLKKTNKTLKRGEQVWWVLFWLFAGVAVWVPNFLTKLANLLGIGRGTDLVLYVSLIIIFYLIFKLYIKIEKTERNITKIVQEIAIKEAEDKE